MPVSFLAAVWDAAGSDRARAVGARMIERAGGGPPVSVVQRGRSVVAAAGPRGAMHDDGQVAAAWVHGRGAANGGARQSAGARAVASTDGLELSRGPFGGRPIFYMKDMTGALLASSQIGTLLPELGDWTLDRDVLAARILSVSPHDGAATAYRGIKRVRPCETIRFHDGPARSSFELPTVPALRDGTPDVLAGGLLSVLTEVVDRVVGSASSVAVLAGGGVDSSGLLAIVAGRSRVRGGRAVAIAYDFAGQGDDRPHLLALQRHLGAEAIRFVPADAAARAVASFSVGGAPYPWTTAALGLEACERARAWGADVLLTGAAGDLVFDGDRAVFAERVGRGDVRAIVDAARLVEPVRSNAAGRVLQLVVKPLIRPAIPGRLLRDRGRRAVRRSAAWSWGGEYLRRLMTAPDDRRGADNSFTAHAVGVQLAEEADARGQAELVAGCDLVDVYLEVDVLTFMASVPPEMYFHNRRTRGLFRHAMRGLLPESVRLRPDKASFEPAIDELVRGMGGLPAFDSLLTMEATADLGLINPRAFRAAFEAHVRGATSPFGWIDLWPAVAVEAFVRGVDTVQGGPVAGADTRSPS